MENIPVTTYRGFSTVSGETTFTQDMADIKNGKHAKLIIKIASLVAQGKVEEANHVKKQLPFRTLTANYRERRLAPSITRYNPVITLDIDDLEEGQLEQTRTLINEDPHTLGSFLSPKRHGYKLFVFMQTEYTRRLYDRLRQGEVTYATLEEIHLKLYSAAKEHYEALLGVEVDGSGKDISRGYFMSFDPHAYINAALLEQISPLPARIIPPAKKENSPKKTPVETVHPLPASVAATPQGAKPWEKLIFSQAVTAVKRTTKFRAGNRDNFLFALGNKCYSKGLDEQTAIRLAKNEFGQEYPDVESPLHNAYIYTDKTSEAGKYSINSLVYWVTYVHNVVYSFYRSMIYCYINSTQRCAGSIVIDIIPTNGADKRKFFPFAPYFPVTNVIKRYFYPYFPAIIGIKGYSFPYFPYLSGIMKIKTALYSLFSRLDWHKTVVFPCLGEIYEGIRSLSWEIPVT